LRKLSTTSPFNGDISSSFEFNEGTHALLSLLKEAFSLCEPWRKNLTSSDVEEGNNLMLTRLTPVATLIDTKQQSATISFKHTNSNVFVTFVQ